MSKTLFSYALSLSIAFGALITSAEVLAGGYSVFGSRTYLRHDGQPVTEVDTFQSSVVGSFTLQISNGGLEDDEYELVSSSIILINGIEVLSPNELNQNVSYLEKTITLETVNEISVEIRGKPGGALILNIEGEETIPPTISADVSPVANANGWHAADPTVTFTCADGQSGIASCTSPVTVGTEGAGQVVTGTAVDFAGNSADTSATINLDKTQPVLTVASPASGITVFDPNLQISGQVNDATSAVSLTIGADSVTPGAGGSFTHTAILQEGINSVVITATDRAGNVVTQTLDITLVLNRAPQATNQSLALDEDNTSNVQLIATDADGDVLSYQVLTQPAQGVLTGVAPNLGYQPNANFNGSDSFTFRVNDGQLDSNDATVSLTVNPVNDAPQADAQSITTNEDTGAAIALTGSDVEGDPLTYQIITQPLSGTLTGTAPNLTYQPGIDFNGTDSFTFRVNDGSVDSADAIVAITVIAVNDIPVADALVVGTDEDTAAAITLTGSDADGDALTYQVILQPTHGVLTGTAPNVSYVPNADFNGNDSFTFIANDGIADSAAATVQVTVNPVNDLPVANAQSLSTDEDQSLAITLSASDVDGDILTYSIVAQPAQGTLTGTPPSLTYQPNADYGGQDSFVFRASDGAAFADAAIDITVFAVNDVPAIDSSPVLAGSEGAPYQYQVAASDPDDAVFTFSLTTAPAGMSVDGNGLVSWTPGFDDAGDHAVSISVQDGQGAIATQNYTLSIANTNRAPQITSSPVAFVVQGDDWTYQVTATDPDGDSVSVAMTQSPAGATFDAVTNTANWSSAGVSPDNYDFEFTVTDSGGQPAIQLVTIEVLSTTRSNTHEGTEFWIPVTINDLISGTTGATFDINLVSNGTNATATVEIPALGVVQTLSLIANQMATYTIDLDAYAATGGLDRNTLLVNNAIHITADSPIAAYFMNQKASTTDGFLGLPTSSLGKDYIAATYIMLGQLGILKTADGGQLGSMTTIVATEDNTQVTIDPIMDIFPGGQQQIEVGNPIHLTMNRGDVYNLETKGSFKADLTGSMIQADKPIGVFGQMECVHVPADQRACDHLVEQLPPIESLATEYYTVPFWGRATSGLWWREYGDTFRIVAPHDGTAVYVNEVLRARLNQGEYFEYIAGNPQHVRTTQPVLMMQYSNGNQLDEPYRQLEADFADPFMVVVPPAEQFLSEYTVNTPARNLAYNFANILVPTSAMATLTVDGQAVDQNLFSEIPNSPYSYAQLPLTQGTHNLTATEPFGIYLYGYDFFESYGYLGGMAFSPGQSVTSLLLSGESSQTLDNEWCADAAVVDTFGRPVNGVRVHFNISGVSGDFDAYRFSDEYGVANYCYRASGLGTDTVNASLNQLSHSTNVTWTTGAQNRSPVFTSIPDLGVVDGGSYSYQVFATDPEGDALIYNLVEGPTGLTIDGAGLVSWPQVNLSAANFNREKVVLSVTDSLGAETRQSFELHEFIAFNTPPEFEPATPSLTATVGVPYVYNTEHNDHSLSYLKHQVLVTDIDEDAAFVDILSGPSEAYIQRILAFNTQVTRPNDPRHCVGCIHYLRWTPQTAGQQSLELGLRDSRGGISPSQTLTVDVAPNLAPEIVNFNPPGIAAAGHEYSYVLDVNNDVQPLPFDNLDNLRVVFEQAPLNMFFELVSAPGTQKLRIAWTPHAGQLGLHTIRLRVDDQVNSSAAVTFDVNVVDDNRPPAIPFANLPNAEVSIPYQYQVIASDPDGDAFTYSLVIAPPGMTIDANTGIIDWTPSAAYENEHVWIRFAATDTQGLTGERSGLVRVDRFVNRAPTFVPAYRPNTAKIGIPYTHQALATDREGDLPINYGLTLPPAGAAIDAQDGTITWTPTVEGSFFLRATATDSLGNFSSFNRESWAVEVLPASIPLDATLSLSPGNIIDPGETATLQITPINAASSVQVTLTVDGLPAAVDPLLQAAITPNRVGRIPISAVITDGVETVTRTIDLFVRDPADNTPPDVQIHSPGNVTTITAPTDIVGTVTDDNLVDVILGYKPANEPLGGQLLLSDFTILYQGPGAFVNQAIARLDTSTLLNGTYHILLQGTDSNDNTNGQIVSVNVDGDLKVGNFSITLEDLNIPLAGIPISVSRTYDSRRRHEELDFGFGWSIDYQNVRLQESDEPTRGWTQTISQGETFEADGSFFNANAICIDPAYDKSVTITLPNGDVEKFIVAARPTNGLEPSVSDPNCYLSTERTYDLHYVPVEGTQSTLVAANDDSLFLAELENGYLALAGDPVAEVITDYTLTTRTGFVYAINQDFGVESITDPNGHSVTFSDTGIVHSSGKSVIFIRDAEGQITAITDPAGNQIVYGYDINGDLTSVTDRSAAVSTHTYDGDHGLLDLFDALGRRLVRNIYDVDGRLIAQEDSDGNITSFSHNVDGRFSVVTNRLGFATQYQYDDRGNVLTQIDALGNTTTYTFDANDNQLSMTDALGNTQSATYNAEDDQLTQTDELGNTTSFTYNSRGQELTITDARNNVFTNTYNAFGNLTSITDPAGNVASNTYIGTTGIPFTITDALGNTTTHTIDIDGNILTETDALGNVTTFTYDGNNNVLTETRTRTVNGLPVSETTSFAYDAEDRVIRTIDALGNITQTEYDLIGNETAAIDALGRRTEMDYDAYGRLVETRYPDGSFETRTYDAEGNVLTETDRLGRVTGFTYDALNRLIQTTLPDGSFTQTEYDALGRVTAEIDANGNRTTHAYDAAGRRLSTTDALGNVHQFAYDADGNLVSETDALLHTTQYVYDSLDRKVQTTFADTTTMQDGFDALARRTSMTDQAGITTQYGYDALGRLISVTDALLNVTSYTYDEAGNKLTQTDAENRTTSWTYDALGRVLTRTLPLGQVETLGYDAAGNLVSKTDFNGDITTYTYDVNDRVTLITYSKDGSTESFTYDAEGNRLTAANGQGTWTYTYDSLDRLASESQPNGDLLEYGYDAHGNKTELKVTYANASIRTEALTYDTLNRLATVTDNDGNITSYGYDAVGNRSSVSYHNGSSQTYAYDNLNRLTRLSHFDGVGALINQYDYTLHPTGRRTQITESIGRTSSYTYDDLYRLTDETIVDPVNGNHSANYQYDRVGNRTFSTVNGVSTAYSYDSNDRLTQQGGETYAYDAQGNTLTRTLDGFVSSYSYNAKQELVAATINEAGSSVTSSYQYNPDGIRTGKAEDDVVTGFLVDSNQNYAQVVAETDSLNNVNVEYTYGDDLISQTRSAVKSHYLYDGLGTTRSLTDSSGSASDYYYYDAFGNTLATTGSTENSYLFTGEQYDQALDQYYLRARYYDPNVGRFTQMDEWYGKPCTPITLNKYVYANADPVIGTDPSGFFTISGLMRGLNAGFALARNSAGSFSRFSVGGQGGVSKKIGCFVGVAYLKKQYTGDGNHGHHTIPKNLGGNTEQALLFLPAETHQMFHFVLDVVLRNTPELEGKGNWTSKKDWSSISRTINGRKQLYQAILKTSQIVDKFCKLKGPASLTAFVKKGRKDFLGGADR